MATFLLLLCIAAGCGVIGILFMLFAPALSGAPRARIATPVVGFTFAPVAAPFVASSRVLSTDFSIEEPVREVRVRELAASPPPLPMVTPSAPIAHVDATTRDAHRVTPPPAPVDATLPTTRMPLSGLDESTTARRPPARSIDITPTTAPQRPPRLGVSAPQQGRHLSRPTSPRSTMPPPLPRTRAARGSDAPPSKFATEQQRTVPRAREDFEPENTFVD